MKIPTVLTIAGSDCSGGAGIQADLKSIAAQGGYGASVITALTAQNTQGVLKVESLSAAWVKAQLEAVFEDIPVDAVKLGMLGSHEVIREVAEALRRFQPRWIVLDPVMVSKSGQVLLPEGCIQALIQELMPLATLVTPNAYEASKMTGLSVQTLAEAEQAGHQLLGQGARAVLVKGGHLIEDAATDVLLTSDTRDVFEAKRLKTHQTHGTGCTLASAIATQLAYGMDLKEAIGVAKVFISAAIAHGKPIGQGVGPTDPFFFLHYDNAPGSAWWQRLRARMGSDP